MQLIGAKHWSTLALAFAVASSAAPASAALILGTTDNADTGLTSPTPTFKVSGAAEAARDTFLALLSSHQTESIDGLTALDPAQNANPGSLSLFSGAATLETPLGDPDYGTNVQEDGAAARILGRWDTTTYHAPTGNNQDPTQNTPNFGGKYLESSSSFEIQFTNFIRAFGIFITDAGDFEGGLSVCISDASDPECDDSGSIGLVLISPTDFSARNGSLRFAGYLNSDVGGEFKVVRFTQGGTDGIGYDDLIIGELNGNVGTIPEPETFALFGVALLAAVASRRRIGSQASPRRT